jgi:hypothetical protein
MKPLTEKDLPVLADIIREAVFRDVYVDVDKSRIFIKCNERLLAIVIIRNGKAFSNYLIWGIPMEHRFVPSLWDWEILI